MIARLPPNALVRPGRLHDAADGELLVAFDGAERDAAADREVVLVGELLRQDERIGLREKDQRIVDDRLVAALEIVVAQAAVAGHVDAEHQQVALARDVRCRRPLR